MNPKKINIVLYEPEIAGNVGAIMRTCVAVDAKLHLIEPLGFILDDRFVVRASANYMEFLDYELYEDWNDFVAKNKQACLFFATRYARQTPNNIDFKQIKNQIYLVFGKESSGIPKAILQNNLENCFRLPMTKNVRSLNVANTVCTIAYEVLRQYDYLDLLDYDLQKGAEYLNS